MTSERMLYEKRLEKIFDMLLLGMTNEEIANHFQITVRSVLNYKHKLEERYMKYQEQKNYNTWALEIALLKNRLLSLYRNLDRKIADSKNSTGDSAKAAQVAMEIALRIMDIENRGIEGVQQLARLVQNEEAKLNAYNNWNELDNEQKRMLDFKRYDTEQNRQF
ncbi:MAG: hypothetical protein MRJ93_12035 [Nitrososphaeraceae archaeon]|nr:hypothetical protein [Nitrososphaeraceae archaeon]